MVVDWLDVGRHHELPKPDSRIWWLREMLVRFTSNWDKEMHLHCFAHRNVKCQHFFNGKTKMGISICSTDWNILGQRLLRYPTSRRSGSHRNEIREETRLNIKLLAWIIRTLSPIFRPLTNWWRCYHSPWCVRWCTWEWANFNPHVNYDGAIKLIKVKEERRL